MKVSTHSAIPVYTIAGANTARPLPEWLIRKRKRSLKKDPEFANRVELLQDFEFEEASSCVRVSEDGNWVMSTGTYKPQIHVHYLPHLSLSFARHTNALNQTFLLLSSDYSKSLHLQSDRFLEFHTPQGCHYSTRIPRYGRDLVYDRRSAEALVTSVGVNAEGSGEVFRLNLELGRFMKAYEVDVGGDDANSVGVGALQGGINTGSVNTAAIAEESHNLLAFGTSIGTVEFWDSRMRSRANVLSLPQTAALDGINTHTSVTALKFNRSGLSFASGTVDGLIYIYDLRSPTPLLKKDQGYGFPIKSLTFLDSSTSTRHQTSEPKILSADKRIIKMWDPRDGTPWTSVEPAVDLNHVEWCRDSGMLLTANEGRQQHAFFIPQLGPAPKWCAFLDNLVEEMAEDSSNPSAFGGRRAGEVYDNFKFLTLPQLRQLNIDHLVGRTSLLRPYMHGFFVSQRLYEEASLISNPQFWQEQRAKSIKEKIDKERESRIRGRKRLQVKVNRRLVEKMVEREEKNEMRKAKRVLAKGGDDEILGEKEITEMEGDGSDKPTRPDLLTDPRFARLFEDEAFEIDESSKVFQALNPSTKVEQKFPKGLTAVEEEEIDEKQGSSSEDSEGESEANGKHPRKQNALVQPTLPRKQTTKRAPVPRMVVSSSNKKPRPRFDASFGSRAALLKEKQRTSNIGASGVVGEREITFTLAKREKKVQGTESHSRVDKRDRRSASGNTFRKM